MRLWKWLAGGAIIAGAAECWVRSRRPDPPPKRRFAAAGDGHRLALDEYTPTVAAKGTVYLQHGLGSRANTFDLHPHGPSLARWLCARGWRVFLGSMRGRETGSAFDWTFSDYLLRDVPALARSVRARAGERFHWVGHSLGGVLGLAYAANSGGRELASVTTIGSALHYGVGETDFGEEKRRECTRRTLRGRRKVWNRLYHRIAAPAAALGLLPRRGLYNPDHMSADARLAFHGHTMADMTVPELFELASTFEGDGIECAELGRRLPDLARKLPVRWLCIVGGRDSLCPPETARWTYDRVDSPGKRWHLAESYGHVDLVCGTNADREIWPVLESFLDG